MKHNSLRSVGPVRLSKIFCHVGCTLVLLVAAGAVHADVRLLIEFVGHEHRLVRVFQSSAPKYRSSSSQSNALKRALVEQDVAHRLIVRWYDTNGVLLHIESVRDPRVAHTPLASGSTGRHERNAGAGKVEFAQLLSGTYLLTGPDLATTLEVALPALRLGEETLPEKRVNWVIKTP